MHIVKIKILTNYLFINQIWTLVCTSHFRQVKQTLKRHVIKERSWWWEGIDLEWCPWRSWGRLCSTAPRKGDQHDKDRIAERTQREPGSRKGKVLSRARGQPLKSWRRTDGAERGKMKPVKKERRQLCGLGGLERGKRGDCMAVVKERCGYAWLFCSVSSWEINTH